MSKKNSKLFFIAILAVAFAACSDKDEPSGGNVSPNAVVPDPEGTITLAMRDSDNGDTLLDRMHIDDNNFSSASYGWWDFASIGQVNGLGNVSYIPQSGWASKVAVIPGYGYVGRRIESFYNQIDNTQTYDTTYYRIYVMSYIESTGGGIIGAYIKYQTPFNP